MEPRPAAERPHLLSELGLDERVDDDRGPAAGAPHDIGEVVDALDHRMADLLERLIGELGLERVHEARRGLAGRIGDDVQLDGLRGHGPAYRRAGTAAVAAIAVAARAGSAFAEELGGGDDCGRPSPESGGNSLPEMARRRSDA